MSEVVHWSPQHNPCSCVREPHWCTSVPRFLPLRLRTSAWGFALAAEALLQTCPSLLPGSKPGVPLKHGSARKLRTTLPLCHRAQATPAVCCPWLGADPTVACSLPKYVKSPCELSGASGDGSLSLTQAQTVRGSGVLCFSSLAMGAACILLIPSPATEET